MANDKDMITKTNDGYVVELFVNTKKETDFDESVEGISLIEHKTVLAEDDQYEEYKKIIDKMDYKPVIIKAPKMQKDIQAVKIQLRAILRAGKHGDVSIVIPQIATVDEVKEYRQLIEECQAELQLENTPYRKNLKIGVIVEIPSVALNSYEIARECDFFFIDTNSLTKYTYANKKEPSEKFELAVIKLVKQAIEGAHDAGIFCGICGDVVENNLYMPLLIGLGLDQFSINSENILNTRKIISELDKTECKYLVEEILQLRTIEDIEKKLKQFTQN